MNMNITEDNVSIKKGYQIYVPMPQEEMDSLNIFLEENGLKKGAFVRRAIKNELAREKVRQAHESFRVTTG